jgi:hypothetical protein
MKNPPKIPVERNSLDAAAAAYQASARTVGLLDRRIMKDLTFVFSARNDNYMGNFIYRLNTAINFLARNLELVERLDRVEFLVADWNSDTPLEQALQLSPAAAGITRFVRIPPAIAKTVLNSDQVFHAAVSFNSVIRRASGRFVMMLDSDALVPRHSLRALFDLLEGRSGMPVDINQTYFVADRRHVPWEKVQSEPTLDGWNDYLTTHGGELPVDAGMPGLAICQGGWLAHRDIWHECRGYDERLGYWGWIDAELAMRISQKHPWAQLSGVGVQIFHMEHWARNQRGSFPKANPIVVSQSHAVNDLNWGLGGQSLETSDATRPPATKVFLAKEATPLAAKTLLAELKNNAHERPVRELIHRVTKAYRGLKLERTAFELIAGCCRRRCPGVYVEYGASIGRCTTSIVVDFNPSVDVYAIDDWLEKPERAGSPACFSTALNKAAFRGYARYLAGDVRTALPRLKKSGFGPFAVDLGMFRERLFEDGALEAIEDLFSCLAPAGAVVCVSDKPDFWRRLEQAVRQNHPRLVFLQVDRVTGLIASPA